MTQYNFPTTILYGEGSLKEGLLRIKSIGLNNALIVTDKNIKELGLSDLLTKECDTVDLKNSIFFDIHSNPIEEDVEKGVCAFREHNCDCILAFGGGASMDVAKAIAVLAKHDGPLSKYDDAKGGDKYLINKMPPIFAVPTTAGTGSEVGRAAVIIVKDTGLKTVIFHPTLLPKIAILEPSLTVNLPANITAATGIDAFTHAIEAYFAPGFHPMADGIALEAMDLVLKNLGLVYNDGKNIEARGKMLLAASMGATAFQKGLGMVHSMAHPLSSECGMHHGLANALCLPFCIQFLNDSDIDTHQKLRLMKVEELFKNNGITRENLSFSVRNWIETLGIKLGLEHHGVKKDQLDLLSEKASIDVCHQTNMVPVNKEDFVKVFQTSFTS